jgi:phage terminase Nu1 subunit (DNA packaging protein)
MPDKATTVDATALAQLFDCTPRHIQLLAERGIAIRTSRGRYNAPRSAQNYIVHLREMAERSPETVLAANAKWKEAQTQLLQERIRREAEEYISTAQAREVWDGIVRGVPVFVMALADEIVTELQLTEHDRERVQNLVRDGLEDCALERGYNILGRSRK